VVRIGRESGQLRAVHLSRHKWPTLMMCFWVLGSADGSGGEKEASLLTTSASNPLNHRNDFNGPALRHGSLNSLSQVAFYLPFEQEETPQSTPGRSPGMHELSIDTGVPRS